MKRTIKRLSFISTHLGERKDILVYLPPQYTTQTTYPCLLLHDGVDYFNLGRVATQAQQLIEDRLIHPIIIAAISIYKAKRIQQYSPYGSQQNHHMQMVVDELMPLLHEEYAIVNQASQHVMGGSSLGGTVSLHIALKYPNQFSRVFIQSGAFLTKTIEEIESTPSLSHLEIYQSIGLSETHVATHLGELNLLEKNREVARVLKSREANIHYLEKAGDHTWGLWQKDIPNGLITFFGTL